ncbi:hypothetical protein Tco_0035951, partial [Tanacetum coccineum]
TQTALTPFVQSSFVRQSPTTTSPSSPLPSLLPSSSRNRSISPLPPLPPVSPPLLPLLSFLPSDMLSPRERVQMTSLQTEAPDETPTKTTTPTSQTHMWAFLISTIRA